jgi:NAD-dependent DNA ligase
VKPRFVVEPKKIGGVVSVRYEDGVLAGATRGRHDGDDITELADHPIPFGWGRRGLAVKGSAGGARGVFATRGFRATQSEREEAGEERFVNLGTAGTLVV